MNLGEVRATLRSLEGKTNGSKSFVVLSVCSIIAGIFFLSPNITGNAIGNITKTSSNILGIVLIVFGVLGVFLKNRN